MNWHEHIDLYCERVDSSFFSEPINAITNLAFIIASFILFSFYRKNKLKSFPLLFLIFLLFLIGLGSFLFHTFANVWSELADTIPIWSFVFFYILIVLRIVFESSRLSTINAMAVVFVFAYIGFDLSQSVSSDVKVLNGSIQYAPAFFLLIVYSTALYLKKSHLCKYGFYAVGIFILSLVFRTLDIVYCESINIGTHFIWHILNAVMLYYLIYIVALVVKEKRV